MSVLAAPSRATSTYWRATRESRYSLIFALPLLLLYEGMAALLPVRETRGVRNGADVILKSLFSLVAGRNGPLLFEIVLIGVCVWLVRRDLKAHGGLHAMRGRIFLGMSVESIVLALVFGFVVGTITARLLGVFGAASMAPMQSLDRTTRLMVSLGAGLYEELLFRVILVSLLALLARRVFHWRPAAAGIFATIVGALLFSTAHYVGAFGDRFTLQSFLFRAISGVFFSAIYLWRGFGIDAWTHALYDVFIVVAS
ncbi:MAG TPA: CPBP family glutamic-type intramembrane protease [Gemmatimonadaceae bacterium]|nr:CPBP family glutamic-type intramembrane protease [Gemmatimonadaceae bacterium]